MVSQEVSDRYYSKDKLLQVLQKTFGHRDFKLRAVGDAYYKFEVPRELTRVVQP